MTPRILVAGIGNMFLGDDGFGVEVARRMAMRPLPEGVRLIDFGIRGMDLVYALLDDWDAVIFVDASPRGQAPGTLSLIEPHLSEDRQASIDTHGMDPVKVLALARELGAPSRGTYVVACEPGVLIDGENSPDVLVELSVPVLGAIDPAVEMVMNLIEDISRVPAS
jgi:hydrogenase maturation protease